LPEQLQFAPQRQAPQLQVPQLHRFDVFAM
jgi:hypothetical protein